MKEEGWVGCGGWAHTRGGVGGSVAPDRQPRLSVDAGASPLPTWRVCLPPVLRAWGLSTGVAPGEGRALGRDGSTQVKLEVSVSVKGGQGFTMLWA